MLFLSTIYHCFWKSNCTRHFPMGGECRVQWKWGAVEVGCSGSGVQQQPGSCWRRCVCTWRNELLWHMGSGEKALKSRRKKRSWESQERTGACRAEESSLSWRTSVINWSDNKMGFPKCQKRAQGRPFTKKKRWFVKGWSVLMANSLWGPLGRGDVCSGPTGEETSDK